MSRLTIDQMIGHGYNEAQMPVDLEFIIDGMNRLLSKEKITEVQAAELYQRIRKIKLDLKHQDRSSIRKNLEELLQYAKVEGLPSTLTDRIEKLIPSFLRSFHG